MLQLFDLSKAIKFVAAGALALSAWAGIKYKYRSEGVQQERASVYKKSNENAAKAQTARRAADKLPPDRLRDKYCRDC